MWGTQWSIADANCTCKLEHERVTVEIIVNMHLSKVERKNITFQRKHFDEFQLPKSKKKKKSN
jgi:hypothetical protein